MTIQQYDYKTIQLYNQVYPFFLSKSLELLVNILLLEIQPSKRLHLKIPDTRDTESLDRCG